MDLDATTLEYTLRKTIEGIAVRIRENPGDTVELLALRDAVALTSELPFSVTLWTVQNVAYELLKGVYPQMTERARSEEEARDWVEIFQGLARMLSLRMD